MGSLSVFHWMVLFPVLPTFLAGVGILGPFLGPGIMVALAVLH